MQTINIIDIITNKNLSDDAVYLKENGALARHIEQHAAKEFWTLNQLYIKHYQADPDSQPFGLKDMDEVIDLLTNTNAAHPERLAIKASNKLQFMIEFIEDDFIEYVDDAQLDEAEVLSLGVALLKSIQFNIDERQDIITRALKLRQKSILS